MKWIILSIAAAITFPAAAERFQPPTSDQIIARTKEAFRKAKTAKEREGITLWCKDSIKALLFKDREPLMLEAIRLMEANRLPEANVLLKQANDIDEAGKNLGIMICRPD